MTDLFDPRTYLFNLTNVVVGLTTFVCFFALGRAIAKQVLEARRERARRGQLHNGPFFGAETGTTPRNIFR